VTGALNALDAAWLAALVLSMLVGLRRGRDAELVALLLCLAVYVGACWSAPRLAAWVPVGTAGGPLNLSAALLAALAAGLVGGWLVAGLPLRLARRPGRAGGPWARVLAAAFGALRAWVLGLMAATAVTLTPAAQSPLWQDSTLARWLGAGVRGVQPLLPPELVRNLPR
jgi:membrane protein required for colicin V production